MELAGVLKKENVEIPGVFKEKLMHMWIFTGLEPGSWFYFDLGVSKGSHKILLNFQE